MQNKKYKYLIINENVKMNDLFSFEDMSFYEPEEEIKEKYIITLEFLDKGNYCRRIVGLKNVFKKLEILINATKRDKDEKAVRITEKMNNFEVVVNEKYIMIVEKDDVVSFFSGLN